MTGDWASIPPPTTAPVAPGTGGLGAGGPGAGDSLAERVEALELRVRDDAPKPWYRQASVLIAIVALVFSIAATLFGEMRAGERDETAARAELSQLIQRLASLPKENADLQETYGGSPEMLSALRGMITTENTVLAQQASDVIRRIPDHVSSSEYFAIGTALLQTGNYATAEELLDAGLSRGTDVFSIAALWRAKGQLYFQIGQIEAGRAAMSRALEAYAAEQPAVAAAADAYTELVWASAEQFVGRCKEAAAHLERAREHVDAQPMSPNKVEMLQMLVAAEADSTDACPSP